MNAGIMLSTPIDVLQQRSDLFCTARYSSLTTAGPIATPFITLIAIIWKGVKPTFHRVQHHHKERSQNS